MKIFYIRLPGFIRRFFCREREVAESPVHEEPVVEEPQAEAVEIEEVQEEETAPSAEEELEKTE